MSFTIKSIKQHGMQDPRWTVRNKITQYKGLIKLYERDAKILQYDRHIAERKLKKQCYQIKKDIRKQKRVLNNAIKSDQQKHRRTLSEHHNLQLAFQGHPPLKTVDYLEYSNFKKRKELDRLHYDVKKKSEKLTEYKLELSLMDDNLIYPMKPIPEEQISQIISGKVKEAQIRQEAALEIYRTYKKILNVLRKDRIYFDTVLNQLQLDSHSQSQFLYRVTEIGQLATEYTDDRKQELIELEAVVKRDMKSRISQIQVMEEQVQAIRLTLKQLIRRESDINLPRRNAEPTKEDLHMQKALDNMMSILEKIKEFTIATTFEDIISCIHNQKNLSKKLFKMYQKKVEEKQTLIKKLEHAKHIHSKMMLANEDTNFVYQQNENALKEEIEDVNMKCNEKKEILEARLEKVNVLRSNLMHLHNLCRTVHTTKDNNKRDVLILDSGSKRNTIIYAPPPIESHTKKLLSDLELRLTNLMSGLYRFPQRSGTNVTELDIEKFYQKFISQISHHVECDTDDFHESLVIETTPRDSRIITYEQIKKESQLLCEANAPPAWMR
ncbi:hypothetical protein ILUMI_26817 [Ignelater luminosus]|uniref:Uncharacterized protein n=1 Tax=Ignelater luminosus TaxID=2038154 RepID=A0A8K0C5W3_IGNLU|nr:hypothetical protein ILUMI_26817 [Ignelater luminosus]